MRGLSTGQEEQWCLLFQVRVALTVLGRLDAGEEAGRGEPISNLQCLLGVWNRAFAQCFVTLYSVRVGSRQALPK